jgi:hypothetical protein
MYAMSWEISSKEYKYESIQDNFVVEFDEYDIDKDLSLDQLLENELEEELELEGEEY